MRGQARGPGLRAARSLQQLAGAAALLGCISVAAAQPLDFKGLPMRASPEAAQEHFQGLRCSATKGNDLRLGTTSCISLAATACPAERCGPRSLATYGSVPIEGTILYFGVQGLQTVLLSLKPEHIDQLAESVTLRFGRPASDERSVIQNRMGAAFEQRVVTWYVGGNQIKVSRYANDVTRGRVAISTPDSIEHMKATRPSDSSRTGDM